LQAFIDGDFQEGGWEAFYHQAENPNASPVGAYLEQRDNLRQRIQQAENTNIEELSNNNGWISEVACPGDGDLSTTTNSCVDKDGNTLSEPAIKTPGNTVNEIINNTVGSDQRRLELADEVNEIVGALADQLVSQVIGGGTGGGGEDDTKGLFSQAAQEKSDALGNFADAADPDSDYGNQLQEEYVRNTLDDQITLEKDLLTVVRKLPDTNDVSKLESRINQCLSNTQNNSGGPSFADKKTAGQIEEQLTTLRSAYNSAFPAAESADEKEVGPQKIDWVGKDTDNWNYGDPQGLESCERWKDAFNVSYVPNRDTQSWKAYMCVHKNGSQFNEKSSEFASKWIEMPTNVTNYFSYGPEDAPGDRPLYRNARNNKIKIDWKGDDLDWKHYDPFAYEYNSWVPEDRVQLDENEETHTGKVWMNKAPEEAQNILERNIEVVVSSSTTSTTTVEEILFQDSLSGHTDLPGPDINDTEGEKFDLVPNKVGDTNRYGAKVCDKRNLGAVSYIVKPHREFWTIQRCNVAGHDIEADSGGFLNSLLGQVVSVVTGPVGAATGYLIDYDSGKTDVDHFRFVDIPLTDYSEFTEYSGKPPAFRDAQGAVDSKGQFVDEIENLLGSTSTTPVDNSFTAPEFGADNLFEIQHDLNTLATSGNPTREDLARRQKAVNNRFGRIEKRFHTEDDLSAVSDALSIVNPTTPNSIYNKLKNTADANGCIPEDDWGPPVDGGGGGGGGGDGINEPEITDFTVRRAGINERFISISWSAIAQECTAKNDSGLGQWSGQVGISGTRVVRNESAVNVSLACRTDGDEDTRSEQVPSAQPSPFRDIPNPRLE